MREIKTQFLAAFDADVEVIIRAKRFRARFVLKSDKSDDLSQRFNNEAFHEEISLFIKKKTEKIIITCKIQRRLRFIFH